MLDSTGHLLMQLMKNWSTSISKDQVVVKWTKMVTLDTLNSGLVLTSTKTKLMGKKLNIK